MPDRFQFVDNPPKVVANCPICGEEIQAGYEKNLVACCESLVCESCQRQCWICETRGCEWCISKKDFNGEYICDICLSNLKYYTQLVKDNIYIPGYYHSGAEETEEEIILEYDSIEHPKFRVCISKEDAGKAGA